MQAPNQMKNLLAPKPVHPTAIRHHGLLGASFVKQHNVISEKWSVRDLIDQFQGMADLISKRVVFMRLQNKAYRRKLYRRTHHLRGQCRNGRTILQNILYGNNVNSIRNHLLNYKDMQRLYQRMPIHHVVDNINQRTFVLRKERDRLTHRLNELKQEFEAKLLERSNIENRLKYENEFILQEDIKSNEILDKLEKSKVRLEATQVINTTYEKVKQVLTQDATFYEPILRGLSKDIDDQAKFIGHILYLGTPAISEFRKLSQEYRLLQDKSRRSSQFTIQTIAGFKKPLEQTQKKNSKGPDLVVNINKRYARETKSMLNLKNKLENIESIIKKIKMATLCSKAKEIFPRFRSQVEGNYKLMKHNDCGQLEHEFWTFKRKLADEKQNVLLHYYSQEEEKRLLRIKSLEEQIKAQDRLEEKTLSYIKNSADVFVILRYSLWNIADTLRYVGRPQRVKSFKYLNSYMNLPLLKFEMQTMRVYPPGVFEEDVKLLLTTLEMKVRTLMKFFDELTDNETDPDPSKKLEELREEYHVAFLSAQEMEEAQEDIEEPVLVTEKDLFDEGKLLQEVPNRNQIKLQSAKVVEALSKRED